VVGHILVGGKMISFFRSGLFFLYRLKRWFSYLVSFVFGYSFATIGISLPTDLFSSFYENIYKYIFLGGGGVQNNIYFGNVFGA